MSQMNINPAEFSVLVTDDEASIRNVLGEALDGWGFQVVTRANAEEGLEYLRTHDFPHIILTDVRMGGMTGIDFAREAKKLSEEIQVIIMTSQGTFDTAVQATKIGVYEYLNKPFEQLEDVRSILVHVCERIYLKQYNEYLIDELQRKNEQVQTWAQMADKLSKNLDVPKTISLACEYLSRVFGGAPTVFLQFIPAERSLLAATRQPEALFGGAQPKFPLPAEASRNYQDVSAFLNSLNSNLDFMKFLEKSDKMSSPEARDFGGEWHLTPFRTRDIPRGVFALKTPHWDQELAGRYLTTAETFFENALLHVKVVENSITDGLTKLNNVRYFKEKFGVEVAKAQRIAHPLSLIFFDVDHFKNYNDKNGHPAGDALLAKMGKLLKEQFRSTDVIARYGGEEFVVIMPHTALVDALAKAEHFRLQVEHEPFDHEEKQPKGKLTISIGVSEFPSHASTPEQLLKAADDALYEAKKNRNTVCQAKPVEGHVPQFASTRIESTRLK